MQEGDELFHQVQCMLGGGGKVSSVRKGTHGRVRGMHEEVGAKDAGRLGPMSYVLATSC